MKAEVKREHRELAAAAWYASNDPSDSNFGPEVIAQALADLEASVEARVRRESVAPWEALREWCSLVPGFRAVTVDGSELVACDADEHNGASRLVEASTAAALCEALGLAPSTSLPETKEQP